MCVRDPPLKLPRMGGETVQMSLWEDCAKTVSTAGFRFSPADMWTARLPASAAAAAAAMCPPSRARCTAGFASHVGGSGTAAFVRSRSRGGGGCAATRPSRPALFEAEGKLLARALSAMTSPVGGVHAIGSGVLQIGREQLMRTLGHEASHPLGRARLSAARAPVASACASAAAAAAAAPPAALAEALGSQVRARMQRSPICTARISACCRRHCRPGPSDHRRPPL